MAVHPVHDLERAVLVPSLLPAGSFQLADLAGIRDVFLPGMDPSPLGASPRRPHRPLLRDIIILTLLTPRWPALKYCSQPPRALFSPSATWLPIPW
ncbi:MAG: hypothetical protein ACLT8E_02835 [Akkermansia sp.]